MNDAGCRPPAHRLELVIRPGTDRDAATAVAVLHADQIAQGFLSLLGPSFLRRLYRRIGRAPDSFLLVADSEGTVAGFVAGSTDVGALYRSFLLRDGIVAGASAAGASAHRVAPGTRHARSREIGERGRGAWGRTARDRGRSVAAPGRGTGRLLVGAFLDELGFRGCDAAHVVVGADNAAAIALYERARFRTADRFELHAGTESLLMQWEREGPSSSGPTVR